MALPIARQMGAELSRIEEGLATLNQSISDIAPGTCYKCYSKRYAHSAWPAEWQGFLVLLCAELVFFLVD